MPNTTPIYGFRYPTVTEDPNVCRDVHNLAEDVENRMAVIDGRAGASGFASYYANALQSISSAGDTKLLFPVADVPGSDISYSAGVFTFNRAGRWHIDAGWRCQNNAAGDKLLWIAGGTSSTAGRHFGDSVVAGTPFQAMSASETRRVAVGDTLAVWHFSSVTYNLAAPPVGEKWVFVTFSWMGD